MRAIDADALKEDLTRFYDNEVTARKLIDEQPTIHPEPHWIPVTEDCECGLMDDEEVLVFQNDGTINGQIRHAMFYDFNGKKEVRDMGRGNHDIQRSCLYALARTLQGGDGMRFEGVMLLVISIELIAIFYRIK